MIGIRSYGIALPYLRLPVEETLKCWRNSNLEFIKNNIGVARRTVTSNDEDVLTLSFDSLNNALGASNFNPEDIEAIILGSSTVSDLFKSNANQLLSFFTNKTEYIGFDVQASENSGMNALICAYSLIKSGQINNAVAVGTDLLNRHIFPSELRESYMGAGSGTFILSNENVIAKILMISNSNSSFPEQGRPEDDRFIRVIAPLNTNVIEEGIIKRMVEAIELVCRKAEIELSDVDYFAFSQNGSQFPNLISEKLKIDKEKVTNSIFSKDTGDTGAASPLISLSFVLNHVNEENKKILLCGYGHSSGATAVLLETTKLISQFKKPNLNKILMNGKNITYEEAMKVEHKYVQPDIALNTYL